MLNRLSASLRFLPLLLIFCSFQQRSVAQAPNPSAALPKPKAFPAPGVAGGKVVLVPRDKMYLKMAKAFRRPLLAHQQANLPPIPTVPVDWTMGNGVPLPLMGNDRLGDCFAAAASHYFTLTSANAKKDPSAGDKFDESALIAWYLSQSPGDTGLTDQDVFPNMQSGWIAPNGSSKILDYLIVDKNNLANIQLGTQLFGPPLWTASLLSGWLNKTNAGATWTENDGEPDPTAGHAMLFSAVGVDGTGNPTFKTETWGLKPPINVTYKGILKADPEIIFCFSLEWFDQNGVAPNGYTYDQLSSFWTALGGNQLPANPFSQQPKPPVPTPPAPVPPAPTPCPPSLPIISGTSVYTQQINSRIDWWSKKRPNFMPSP